MKNLSIKQRIYYSFLLLVALFVIKAIITTITLNKNKNLSAHISKVVDPSLQSLEDFKKMMIESKMYTTNWVFLRSKQEDKDLLEKIHNSDYQALKSRINLYASQWMKKNLVDSLNNIFAGFEQLLSVEKEIMFSLRTFKDYDDPVIKLEAERKVEEEVLPRTAVLMATLNNISSYGQAFRREENKSLELSSIRLRAFILLLAIAIIGAGILLSIYLTRAIITPINKIRNIINDLGKGIIRKLGHNGSKDEIGEMIHSVNHLSENLLKTATFAHAIGLRNFDIPFEPLSEEDTLGKSLIAMRDNLKTSEMELQQSTNDLHKKDELLQAVALATLELITNNNLEEAIGNNIKLLGNKMQTEQVNVYKAKKEENGSDYIDQIVQWDGLGGRISYHNPDFQNIPFHFILEEIETLRRNEVFCVTISEMRDPQLKEWFQNRHIYSMVSIPIFFMNEFWGFVSFNDCKEERKWTETEFSILHSFAITLGSVIERNVMEEQLLASKEKAEAASKAKSEFMANMSHELRTPMNGIIGFTDLVLTTELQRTQRDYLKNVSKSAYSLLNIINDILDFSKIEAGRLIIDKTVFDLNELVEEAVDILSIKAEEKGLEIICSIDPMLPSKFLGDAVRIKQILINLLGNAIKFTARGEIFVNVQSGIAYKKEEEDYLDITISVKDTGIGISQEKLTTIFESFTQADNSTTRKFGGTGLGLTISKQLAELMEGSLEVESELGKGSLFTFYTPLKIENAQPPITFESKPLLREVLVVDDNETNCKLMKGIFDYLHIPCKICYSGPDALVAISQALTNNQMFDLIITDHQMPVMDGITLVKEIKKILQGHTEPFILMLSSLEKTLYQHEAEEIGIDKFLNKPVKLQELNSILSTIFQQKTFRKNGSSGEIVTTIEKLAKTDSVLVVEDDPVNMLLISEVLHNMGVEVLKANNGKEALEVLSRHNPGMIFMDINMPEMDGYETTGIIRKMPLPKSSIPIVALTADAMKEDKERCLASGMNDYISKPFKLEEIRIVLNKYFAGAE
ncbi:MAG TPA: response regulator [Chitinophagaceae bacterium]|nr:response regulator [Chitinophagaceae bacterium]